MTTLPRAVELIRVSTEGQAERDTPELQRRALDKLRQTRPCVVVERIEALGVSGALGAAHRADLRRLESLSRGRAFDELRVWSVDRLTRSADMRERAAIWGYALDSHAVIVDASGRVLDPADDSGIGEIDYYLQTFFASRERAKIIARTMAGRRRAAEDGRLSQGQPPYGRRYDHETRQWVEVPEQMAICRRIVAETLAGRSTRAICAGLVADGVPPARRAWFSSTVKRILKPDHLLGRYRVCGFTQQLPPVCDEATAKEVRTALASRLSSVGPKPLIPAMLRGMLWCPCGDRLRVVSDGKGSRPRYKCPGSDSRWLRVSDTDATVRGWLLATLLSPAMLNAAAALGRDGSSARESIQPEDLDAQEARLRAQERRVVRLLDDGLLSEDVARERLANIRTATRAVEAKRAELPQPSAVATGTDLLTAAAEVASVLTRATWSHWRDLLGVLKTRITVTPSSLLLTARLPLISGASAAGDSAKTCSRRGQDAVEISLVIAA